MGKGKSSSYPFFEKQEKSQQITYKLRNQPALSGIALSDDFDGKILNPDGVEIDLPFWVFKRLKKLHLLDRDPGTGMRRIQARIFGLMDLWDGPDFRPDRRYRAFDSATSGPAPRTAVMRARSSRRSARLLRARQSRYRAHSQLRIGSGSLSPVR